MAKLIRHLALIIPIFYVLAACVTVDQGSLEKTMVPTPSNSVKTVIVTPSIKGNTASLNVGDTLEIRIPTIPKEGFEWKVKELDSTILNQVGEATYEANSSPNSAGGMVTLQFTAAGKGKTTLNLLYASTTSSGLPALSSNSFSVTVEVK